MIKDLSKICIYFAKRHYKKLSEMYTVKQNKLSDLYEELIDIINECPEK